MKHIKKFNKFESLIQKSTLDQLKRVKGMMKGVDIDDKVRKDIKEPPMQHHDPLKSIETYQQYMAKPFKTNQNVVSQVKESIQDIYSSLNNKYGEACNVQMTDDYVEIHSPMKYIVDDLSEQYGGEVMEIDDHYYLKIK